MQYIFITEFGDIYQSDTFGDDEKNAHEMGVLDVMRARFVAGAFLIERLNAESEWQELENWPVFSGEG